MRCLNRFAFLLAGVALATPASKAAADPPQIVARVSFVTGAVSYRASSAVDWTPAVINYPVTVGDSIWTDRAGRTELQLGPAAVRLAASTSLGLVNLDHHVAQLRLTAGTIALGVRDLGQDDALEVDTPNGTINVVRPGFYRVDVSDTGDGTTVTVRHGEVEVAASGSAFSLRPGQSAYVTGIDSPSYDLQPAVRIDEFEDWALYRDRRAESPLTVRYVSHEIVGYEDLDEFGTWRVAASYGPVWVPHVRVDWAPYRFGHWAWVEPWGWTWIDDAAWGFAPFHYGRWVYLTDGWAWVPGAIVARPVYAPALVAFVGGANFRLAVSIGQPIAWFPLGPREVYVPAYRVSPEYVRAVNVAHVTNVNVTNINVTNVTYVNQAVPGAVTAVSRDAFVQARPVSTSAVPVPVDAVRSAPVVGHTANVAAPARPAVVRAAAVVAPPPAIVNRPVVVRTPPPPSIGPALVRTAAISRPAPKPAPVPAPSPSAPQPTAIARAPQPAPVVAAAPDRAAAAIMARQAEERVTTENRHAQERAETVARQRQDEQRANDARARDTMRAQHERELQALDTKHQREHEELHNRQEQERRNRGGKQR